MKFGAAISQDGLVWTKYGDEPLYQPNTLPGNLLTFVPALVHHADTYYLFVDGFTGGISEVYVLTYKDAGIGD